MSNIKYNSEDLTSHHAIAAIVKNNDGDILMQEHVKYGFWTIPVGKVKNGQTIEDGLRQEIFEECNILVNKIKEIKNKKFIYNRDGNKVSVFAHLFEVLEYRGEVKNKEPHKHSKQIFMSLEEIKKLPYLSDMTLLYLEIM